MAKILVVDDSPTMLAVAKATLESKGHEVVTAVDGQEGLDKARAEAPKLIVLDVMLPKIDGRQVCRMLKFDQNYKKIPILMFTTKVAEEDRQMGQEVGADEYVSKNFESDEFINAVNKLLKN